MRIFYFYFYLNDSDRLKIFELVRNIYTKYHLYEIFYHKNGIVSRLKGKAKYDAELLDAADKYNKWNPEFDCYGLHEYLEFKEKNPESSEIDLIVMKIAKGGLSPLELVYVQNDNEKNFSANTMHRLHGKILRLTDVFIGYYDENIMIIRTNDFTIIELVNSIFENPFKYNMSDRQILTINDERNVN